MSQNGSKIILFNQSSLIAILRDDVPHIKFPNFWDLPGGGIEEDETPRDALFREIDEELGLRIQPDSIVWEKEYSRATGFVSHFFAAPISREQIGQIRFGDEGQKWELMQINHFCSREDAVPHFRPRVAEFFRQL